MTSPQHSALAAGRWATLSLAEQFANIGSEVERALKARDEGRADRSARALDRALELFDLTAADARWRGSRRREALRGREYVCSVFFGETEPDAGAFLRKYFLQFATVVRRARNA